MIGLCLSGSQGGVDVARGGLDLGPGVPGGDLALLCQNRRAVEPGGAGIGPSSARPLQGHLQHPLILQPTPHGEWTLQAMFISPNKILYLQCLVSWCHENLVRVRFHCSNFLLGGHIV